jgi:hypothetical protein
LESLSFEKKIVSLQLGRDLKNDFTTAMRCTWGYPQVIKSSLVSDGRPFPTLFWLTCPLLRREVSLLESQGLISYFEDIMERDRDFAEAYSLAHNETRLLKQSILEELQLSEWLETALIERGIGGLKDRRKVKCLHLQLANFLGGISNPVGREVWKRIERRECLGEKIICEELVHDV